MNDDNRKRIIRFLAVGISAVGCILAHAADEPSDHNRYAHAGHTYELLYQSTTWTDAAKKCHELGGYLAVFETEEEYLDVVENLVFQQIDYENKRYFLGARRDAESKDYFWTSEDFSPREDLEFLTSSSSWCLSYWNTGEPSYYHAGKTAEYATDENVIELYYSKSKEEFFLNDVASNLPYLLSLGDNQDWTVGFICEYD